VHAAAAERPGKPGRTDGAGLGFLSYDECVVVDVVAATVLVLMLADLARMLFVDSD
jgi:hypothetical protein